MRSINDIFAAVNADYQAYGLDQLTMDDFFILALDYCIDPQLCDWDVTPDELRRIQQAGRDHPCHLG